MSSRSMSLVRLLWGVFCVNVLLFILWLGALFWFDLGDVATYAVTALLVISVVAGRMLRNALTKSLRRDAPGSAGF